MVLLVCSECLMCYSGCYGVLGGCCGVVRVFWVVVVVLLGCSGRMLWCCCGVMGGCWGVARVL